MLGACKLDLPSDAAPARAPDAGWCEKGAIVAAPTAARRPARDRCPAWGVGKFYILDVQVTRPVRHAAGLVMASWRPSLCHRSGRQWRADACARACRGLPDPGITSPCCPLRTPRRDRQPGASPAFISPARRLPHGLAFTAHPREPSDTGPLRPPAGGNARPRSILLDIAAARPARHVPGLHAVVGAQQDPQFVACKAPHQEVVRRRDATDAPAPCPGSASGRSGADLDPSRARSGAGPPARPRRRLHAARRKGWGSAQSTRCSTWMRVGVDETRLERTCARIPSGDGARTLFEPVIRGAISQR